MLQVRSLAGRGDVRTRVWISGRSLGSAGRRPVPGPFPRRNPASAGALSVQQERSFPGPRQGGVTRSRVGAGGLTQAPPTGPRWDDGDAEKPVSLREERLVGVVVRFTALSGKRRGLRRHPLPAGPVVTSALPPPPSGAPGLCTRAVFLCLGTDRPFHQGRPLTSGQNPPSCPRQRRPAGPG